MVNQLDLRGNKLLPARPLFTCHMHKRCANLAHIHFIYMKYTLIYADVMTVKRKAFNRPQLLNMWGNKLMERGRNTFQWSVFGGACGWDWAEHKVKSWNSTISLKEMSNIFVLCKFFIYTEINVLLFYSFWNVNRSDLFKAFSVYLFHPNK